MPNIRIKTKSGEVIDLAEARMLFTGARIPNTRAIAVLDALEKAMSVKPCAEKRYGVANIAYNNAIADIRQAAGVVEEGE